MKVNCQYCNEEVDRETDKKLATCFDCKKSNKKEWRDMQMAHNHHPDLCFVCLNYKVHLRIVEQYKNVEA